MFGDHERVLDSHLSEKAYKQSSLKIKSDGQDFNGWQVFLGGYPSGISTGNGMYGTWNQKSRVQIVLLPHLCYNVEQVYKVIHSIVLIENKIYK